MTRLLVVDDNPGDRRLVRAILSERADLRISESDGGTDALARVLKGEADMVLTDLRMPDMTGLQLTRRIREGGLALPIVLMTSHGSEQIAAEALRNGATSYVPKDSLLRDLLPTFEALLMAVSPELPSSRATEALDRIDADYILPSDPTLIEPIVAGIRDHLAPLEFTDETSVMQLSVALAEALQNALYHGNLEVSSALRESGNSYYDLAKQRRTQAPYANRKIYLSVHITAELATFTVRDEGPGFDVAGVPDPRDPENIQRMSGRGLFLINMFMDEVRFNEAGNEITMVKRADSIGPLFNDD